MAEAKQKPVDWQQLIVGTLTGISVIGAAVSSWQSGQSAGAADRARAEVVITTEMMERARSRAAEIEARLHDLERRVRDLEPFTRP